ncbi:hypothetical protein [Streptomyces niveus]|uniref:hypothetical protein n=1 Tax=Streptomyces niveus TaxID=193462 RepID=UPI0036878648
MSNDPVLNAVQQLRPQEEAEGWSRSSQGQHVLESVLSRAQGAALRRRPSRTMVTAGALLALVAGGGAMAAAGGLPWNQPGSGGSAMCARTLSREADLAEVATTKDFDPRDPGASCARGWTDMWGTAEPVPASFTACFHPGAQVPTSKEGYRYDPNAPGGPVIYPADGLRPEQACARIGAKPIPVGP